MGLCEVTTRLQGTSCSGMKVGGNWGLSPCHLLSYPQVAAALTCCLKA